MGSAAGLMLDPTDFHRRVPQEVQQETAEWMSIRCEGRPVLRAELLGEGRMRCWTLVKDYERIPTFDIVWMDTHHWGPDGQLWRNCIVIERCFYITDQPPPALLAAFFPPAVPPPDPTTGREPTENA